MRRVGKIEMFFSVRGQRGVGRQACVVAAVAGMPPASRPFTHQVLGILRAEPGEEVADVSQGGNVHDKRRFDHPALRRSTDVPCAAGWDLDERGELPRGRRVQWARLLLVAMLLGETKV